MTDMKFIRQNEVRDIYQCERCGAVKDRPRGGDIPYCDCEDKSNLTKTHVRGHKREIKSQEMILNSTPKTKEEAREQAVVWQEWQSEQSMSYGEVAWWNNYFKKLGKKFGLTEEFNENAII